MQILKTSGLLAIFNFTNWTQTEAKMKLKWPHEYIKYLLENKLIEDFKIIYLDTKKEEMYYSDFVFLKIASINKNFIEHGFLFEKRRRIPQKITKEVHLENITHMDLSKVNPYECINIKNLTFKKDPFSNFICDSKLLASYITWKYNLDYKLLLFDILKYHNLTKKCIICSSDYLNMYNNTMACKKCTCKVSNSIVVEKRYNRIELIKKIQNIECPICGASFLDSNTYLINNVSLLAKHFTRKHKLTIQNYIDQQQVENRICECGSSKLMLPFCDIIAYNNKLSEIFYDFNIFNDFVFYKNCCKKRSCSAKNLIVMVKKIFTFMSKIHDNDIIDIIEEIRYNYHNIEKYRILIHYVLSSLREYTKTKQIEYMGFILYVYSKLEEYNLKNIINTNTVKVLNAWQINRNLYDFKYFDKKERRYVPDFYTEDKNGYKKLYEIKSCWTFGIDLKNNKLKNETIFKINLKKFKSANTYCVNNNIEFILIIDDKTYTYKELINELRKGKYIK